MQCLKNKTVFITGASSGIGKACAEQFAALGANIIIAARRLDRIQALAETLKTAHDILSLPIELDVRNQEQVQNAVAQLPNEWKNIDILVNNAGLALGTDPLHEGKVENWDAMIDTNIKGLLYVTHAVLPGMVSRNSGHVINIGSMAGREIYPNGNVMKWTHPLINGIKKCQN